MSPAATAEPFFLDGGPTGCLLLHGFSATPQEMRFLGERLQAHGYTVSGICLAGHGTTIDAFAKATWQEWYTSAQQGLATLQGRTARTVVVGQSMGALLALCLAAEQPHDVLALALLAPALRLSRRWLQWVRPWLPLLARGGRAIQKDAGDVADSAARMERSGYRSIPLTALYQLLMLQRHTDQLLPRVHQPSLIVHSRQDHTISLAAIGVLERRLAGPVESLVLEQSFHVVSVDVDKERVANTVGDFIAGVVDPAAVRR